MKLDVRLSGIAFGGSCGDRIVLTWWKRLPKRSRYWGRRKSWSNGPLSHFGWWFGEVTWRLPWTKHDGGIRTASWVHNKSWMRQSRR